MLLVIDTNVLVNAIKGGKHYDEKGNWVMSNSQRLIASILNGQNRMVVSSAVMEEYNDVLHREHLKLNPGLVDKFLAYIHYSSIWIEPLPTSSNQVEMKDEDDRIFFDLARCLKIYLVTNNLKDYPVHELRVTIDDILRIMDK